MTTPRRFDRYARGLEGLCAVAGAACLLWSGATLLAAARYQRAAERTLERERAAGGAAASRPAPRPDGTARGPGGPRAAGLAGRGAPARAPAVVGRIEIPSAHVTAMIAEGDDARTLALAVGHLPGSALPGNRGITVLAGHRDSFFRGLERVRRGDIVRVTTPRGAYVYRVVGLRVVPPRATGILHSGPERGLTLVTCYPFGWIGPAPMRYVVQAAQVAARRGGPAGSARATGETVAAHDPGRDHSG